MKFASVIVDVPARQTDRPFDYIIPKKWEDIVQTGMRVVVPFGPRKLQGFIIGIKDSVELESKKLKALYEILDVTPVLNDELLKLGYWLTSETLCYMISAFQVMLPTAIKATYKKRLQLRNREEEVAPEILSLFQGKETIDWEVIEAQPHLYRTIQQEIKNGTTEVVYQVKDKVQKKKQRVVQPELPADKLELAAFELKSKNNKMYSIIL